MRTVYVYRKHEGCTYEIAASTNEATGEIENINMTVKNPVMLADRELSDIDRFCNEHEDWDTFIGKADSKEELKDIFSRLSLEKHFADELIGEYENFMKDDYQPAMVKKEELRVGYFFYIDGNFAFSGCKLSEAEIDGDFLVYQKNVVMYGRTSGV